MSYNVPVENSLWGLFQPMRFEATVDDCIVTHGQPRGCRWRLLPRRSGVEATDPAGHQSSAEHRRPGPGDHVRGRRRQRQESVDPYPEVHPRGRPKAGHFGVGGRRPRRMARHGVPRGHRTPWNEGVSRGVSNINIFPLQGELLASRPPSLLARSTRPRVMVPSSFRCRGGPKSVANTRSSTPTTSVPLRSVACSCRSRWAGRNTFTGWTSHDRAED